MTTLSDTQRVILSKAAQHEAELLEDGVSIRTADMPGADDLMLGI